METIVLIHAPNTDTRCDCIQGQQRPSRRV